MRKKSHISLAGQIMDSMELDNVFDYRLPFYVGSIWPDCRPSFVTTPHKFDITFDDIERKISKFIANYDKDKGMNMRRCAGLGVIIHYIADYFTFPHNDIFDGNIREHCKYEKHLKKALKQYIRSRHVAVNRQIIDSFTTPQDLIDYVIKIHNQYLSCDKTVESDCMYIVSLCHVIVAGILNILTMNRNVAAA